MTFAAGARRVLAICALSVVMLLWGAHLAYPLQRLQHIRWTFAGHVIPVYYFFIVLPMLGAGAAALALRPRPSRWMLAWLLLPLICIPGILSSSDPLWSVRQWSSWLVRGVVPGGVIFLLCDQRARAWLLRWIYPIVIAAALLGLAELYINDNPIVDRSFIPIPPVAQQDASFYRPMHQSYSELRSLRPQGTQGNRVPYAALILAFLPLGIWLLKYEKRFYGAQLLGVGGLASILLLAQVRAVWVGVSAAVLFALSTGLLKGFRGTARIAGWGALCLCVLLLLPKTRTMLFDRFRSFNAEEISVRTRLDVLQTAAVLKDRWLAGVGFGQFPAECRRYYRSDMPWSGTPDNQYLRWAIENGVVSLGLLAAFLFWLVRSGLQRVRSMRDPRQADFYRSLLVGWGGLAVSFLFFDGFYWGACNMTFWSMLGMFATCLEDA